MRRRKAPPPKPYRDRNDSTRYKRIYGIDNDKPELVADLIIDTDELTPENIVDKIIEGLEVKKGSQATTRQD